MGIFDKMVYDVFYVNTKMWKQWCKSPRNQKAEGPYMKVINLYPPLTGQLAEQASVSGESFGSFPLHSWFCNNTLKVTLNLETQIHIRTECLQVHGTKYKPTHLIINPSTLFCFQKMINWHELANMYTQRGYNKTGMGYSCNYSWVNSMSRTKITKSSREKLHG